MSYTKPGASELRSVWGTTADGFQGQTVTHADSGDCESQWLGDLRTGSVIVRAKRPFATDMEPRKEWFTVAATGGPVTVTGAAFSPDDPHVLELSLSRELAADETVTMSYRRPRSWPDCGTWTASSSRT